MALDFPANPTNGQYYNGFVYNAANSSWDSAYAPRAATIPISSPNYIINGAFDIWQRGTSSSTGGYQTADRWYNQANNTTTFVRDTDVPEGFQYSHKLTAVGAANVWNDQVIETINSLPLVNKAVTLSAYIKASASTAVSLSIYYSTVVDNPASYVNTNWTLVGTQSQTVSTTWSRYSYSATIPATAKTIMVKISSTSSISAGTSIWFTGVQLEQGTLSDFRRNAPSIQAELAACQRYYVTGGPTVWYGYVSTGQNYGTTATFPVTMRANPTIGTTRSAGQSTGTNNPAVNELSPSSFDGYVGASATDVRGYFSFKWTASAEL